MPPAKTKKPFTPKLERFLATVAYDGTDHIGWQVQTGRLSIQGELEARLSRILKTPIVIHGSGRTDSGVHSVGQRFHFDAFWPHPCSYLVHAINSCEQNGLLATQLQRVAPTFIVAGMPTANAIATRSATGTRHLGRRASASD